MLRQTERTFDAHSPDPLIVTPTKSAHSSRSREDPLAALNTEQRCAVESGIDAAGIENGGPLLIIAGAGSGKTHTLAFRVAHLVKRGADPQRILVLTFSRRAAAELERRAEQLLIRVLGGTNRAVPTLPWS